MKIFCRSIFLFLEGCILLSRVHVSEAFESLLCKKYYRIYLLFVILIIQINKVIQKEKKHRALVDDFVEF